MKKSIELNEFVYLMLGILANNSKLISLEDSDIKIACIPTQYKQIIQNILCAENGWKERFSILIDVEDYFTDHFDWERRLSLTIEETLNKLNKKIEYDLVNDRCLVYFTKNEVNIILEKYSDEELKIVMDHFTSLLVDYIYTREFQERFYDYSAVSIKKMHDIRIEEFIDPTLGKQSKSKIKRFFKY